MSFSVYIGFEPRESAAFAVARETVRRHLPARYPIRGLILRRLQAAGLYTRPTERRLGKLYDVISKRSDYDGAMSAEFAISRFLVPFLAGTGWGLFMDCDMMVRSSLSPLLEIMRESPHAVLVVKHEHEPTSTTKMDGQQQTVYPRKNWSSFMGFNCDHPANKRLTVEVVNALPGRDLHRFCWLKDHEIGELPQEYNYLVGHTKGVDHPKVVHFTDGYPLFSGFENVEYADEWRDEHDRWAA